MESMFFLLLQRGFLINVLHHKAGDHESENGGGVRHGSVDLRLGAAPFVIDEVFILKFRFATLVTDFGAHASVSSARGAFPAIFQEFVAIDAYDFLFREKFFALELVAESASERASGNFPEFGDLDSRGIHLESGSH